MKKPKKTAGERLKGLKDAVVGGGGDRGVATAGDQSRDKASFRKAGLGPVSDPTTKKIEGDPSPEHTRMPMIIGASALNVSLLRGDDGDTYYQFEAEGRSITIASAKVLKEQREVFVELRKIGIYATSHLDRAAVSKRIDKPNVDTSVTVVTRVGFERASTPRYFIYGDGSIITSYGDLELISTVQDRGRFESLGDLQVYETAIAKVVRNQSVPTALFFFALAPVMKPFVSGTGFKAENAIFELVGPTSMFKSALACTLAGSAWGKGQAIDGYARDWNFTQEKINELFSQFSDHLLILDEATMADSDVAQRAKKIQNVAHRLSSGQGRARTGEEAQGNSVSILSTSNQPIRTIVAETEDVRRALEVRLISFQLPSNAPGFFDRNPKGFESVRSAMEHVFEITEKNYGLLARKYIQDVLQLLKDDAEQVRRIVKGAMARFFADIGVGGNGADEVAYRRAQLFALAYAAAIVAFKAGTLQKKKWGRVKRSIRRAWLEYGSATPQTGGIARITAYLLDPSHRFVNVLDGKISNINDENFGKIDGFLYKAKDKSLRLAVPNHAKSKLGLPVAVLKRLKEERVLHAGGGTLQSKRKLRRRGEVEVRDGFYVFSLAEIPSGIKIFQDPKAS